MKHLKLLALMLALCLLAAPAPAEESPESLVYSHLGEALADFSVTTIDGGVFSLSEALQEKDLVLINLWATWCGPCREEFPFLEEAYEQYQEDVAVIALSVEPEDTDEVLADFAESFGLTFPVGSDTGVGLGDIYAIAGIPTSLAVDRFGNVAFIEIGSQPSASSFTRLFDAFLGDDYTQSTVLEAIPPARPNVSPADPAELDAALNVEGGALAFSNPEDGLTWPMLPVEIDGRVALVSTNAGEPETCSAVSTIVAASEGDALAFDFRTSTEAASDMLQILVNGEVVKSFSGEHDWTTWAIALPEGVHGVDFRYWKDPLADEGEDAAYLDEVRVLSGGEAEAALAALPVNPVSEAFGLTIVNADAREIAFDDPDAIMYETFLCDSYWIVPSDTVEAEVTLTGDIDPETAFGYNNYDGLVLPLSGAVSEDGGCYVLTTGIDSLQTTGYTYSNLYVYPYQAVESADDFRGAMLFRDEENVNAFIEEMAGAGISLDWSYADGSVPGTDAVAAGELPQSVYTVRFVDQDGAPVPGCIINFCTDTSCVPVVADENGVAVFAGEPFAYHLQVIRVPEGYGFDTQQEFYAEEEGGEMTFEVERL